MIKRLSVIIALGIALSLSACGNTAKVNEPIEAEKVTEAIESTPEVTEEPETATEEAEELSVIYADDEEINLYLNRYNEVNVGQEITADQFEPYKHHGSVHKNQIKLKTEETTISATGTKVTVYLEANGGHTEADLQRELSRKSKLLDAYLDGILNKQEYQKKAEELDERIIQLKAETEKNKANSGDIAEIDKVLANIDEEVSRYVDGNEKLKVEYLLEHLEQVQIFPDKVIVIVPILSEGIVVEKAQYVSREKHCCQSKGFTPVRYRDAVSQGTVKLIKYNM